MLTLYAIAMTGIGLLTYPNYPADQCWAEAKRMNDLRNGYHYTCVDDTDAPRVR